MPLTNQVPTSREEYLKKKRKKRHIKYGIILFLFSLIFGVFIYLAHRPELSISEVGLQGGVLVTEEDIKARTLEYLEGKYLWIFPVKNSLWYPRGELEKYLKESFKRIDTIKVSRKDFHKLTINIVERKPFALWCDKLGEIKTSDSEVSTEDSSPKCYFMDSNSTVFAPAPLFSGDAYFKYYGILDEGDPIGKYYLASSTEFSEISSLISATKKMLLRPQYLLAKGNDEFSLIVSGGAQIYFDTKKPLKGVIENLEALLKTPALAIPASGNLPVEYIDLRFGNKLFYK